MHGTKPISLLILTLLLLAMIAVKLNISTEVQASSFVEFNPLLTLQPSSPDNQSSDDDDDGDDDDGDDDDNGDDEEDEDTSQPNPPDSEPPDNDEGGENIPPPRSPDNESADDDDEDGSTNASTPRFVITPLNKNPGPESDRGVQPVFIDGNPQGGDPRSNCGVFGNYKELRIGPLDNTSSGNYSDGILSLDIVVTLSATDGPSFDWNIASDSLVDVLPGIFVKGGNNGNWYDYSGFTDVSGGGATFDGFLHAPVNPNNGKFFGLSHVSFCYQVKPGSLIQVDTIDTSQVPEGDSGDTNHLIFTAWVPVDSETNEGVDDGTPSRLPETGVELFWDYSFIATLLTIGGLNLTIVGLYSYLLLMRLALQDRKEEGKE